MRKGENYNHPKMGSTTKVDPIKSTKHIQTIKKLLADKQLDFALFTVGINTNLRASDLLRIKVAQVKDLKPNDEISINEKKTKKPRRIIQPVFFFDDWNARLNVAMGSPSDE